MKPKILILSDSLPGTQGGHGIILQKQILNYGKEDFCLFSGERTVNFSLPEFLNDLPILIAPIDVLRGKRISRIIKRIPLLEELIFFLSVHIRKHQLVSFVRENKVDLIYAVLRGDSVTLINYLIKKTQLPIVSYIPDTIEAEKEYDKSLVYKEKEKEYYKLIERSSFLAAPGESMVQYLQKKFNKKSVIFSSILDINYIPSTVKGLHSKKSLTIGFAGSLYAKEEFNQFTEAVSCFAQKHKTLKIKLLLIGDIKPFSIERVDVEIFNWTTQEKVLKIISNIDIAYLPYKFCGKYKTQMKYAFPSKIVTYLALQRPIFFHGPIYSSVNVFFEKYACGISCNYTSIEKITECLENLVFDSESYQKFQQNCLQAYNDIFSEKVQYKSFNYFIEQGLINKAN